jgi:hypothetical protein
MATIQQDITVYENEGTLLQIGPTSVLQFSDFQTEIIGEISLEDDNGDQEWDLGEIATFDGQPATFVGSGQAFAGVTVDLLVLPALTVQLSTPVNLAAFNVGATQYLRFYNDDGSDADPAALLDQLASQLVAELTAILAANPLLAAVLEPVINPILADPLTFVENNAVITVTLDSDGALIPCFTAGTLIATDQGERPVENLAVGDRVMTLDNGVQPIRWIGMRTLSASELDRAPNLRPICIAAGALGDGLPHQPLVVSPQHRCLVRSRIAERMFGSLEVLIAAKHLLGWPGVSVVADDCEVTYVHMLFDRHELVWSMGALTESFYPGEMALAAVDQAARDEVLRLFPGLDKGLAMFRPAPARPFTKGRLARKLVERSLGNRKPLIEGPATGQTAERRKAVRTPA